MITGSQIRAARALLNWSGRHAAEQSGVSYPTLQRLEQHDGFPPSRTQTLEVLKKAFEEAGIEFVGGPSDAPGVRLRKPAN